MVSVPYRGAHFSMRIMLNTEKITLTFPSPIGELHFSMIFFMSKQMLIHRFRLLSGSYISQFGYSVFCIKLSPMFPSPIGELHFSIITRQSMERQDRSFRPLSGSYISQFYWTYTRTRKVTFPSPIGELHFSMIILIIIIEFC